MRGFARCAAPEDVPALKVLWAEVFGDESAYIDLFFARLFRPKDYAVLCEPNSGELLSMAALLPVTLVCEGKRFPIAYLYGMATRPSAQGKGCGLQLLDFAADWCRQNGKAGIALQPADEGLLRFYAKAGYAPAFSGCYSPACYIDYPKDFLQFAKDAGYDVPAAEDPQRSVPGVFLSFDASLQPQNGYLAYPLD